MDDGDKPMLNSPIETGTVAGEEFEKNLIARMEGARDARVELQGMAAESPEAQQERLEKFREESFARIEELTGLTFDRETGKCTTQGTVKMEGELREKWAALSEQLGAPHDAQKGEEILRESGRLLREAIEPPPTE
jgi:hypothetical protein